MEKLSDFELERLLNHEVTGRVMIDDSKDGRIIKKILLPDKPVLVKYGYDEGIVHEALVYGTYFNHNDPVPAAMVNRTIEKGGCFLALEWIEGTHPDFNCSSDIQRVFAALGKWISRRQVTANMLTTGRGSYSHITNLKELIARNHGILTDIAAKTIVEALFKQCHTIDDHLVRNIERTPLTFDPGDISLHNAFIDSKGEVYFIDFESCKIRPLVMLFEHFGESYGSIPNTPSYVELALKTFLNEWNTYSAVKISWETFMQSHLCARLYYKIGDFYYWFNRIVQGRSIEETLIWIEEGFDQWESLLVRFNAMESV